MSETVLDQIIAGVREDLAEREAQIPLAQIVTAAEYAMQLAPAQSPAFDTATLSVIAEVKRSSPSKGALAAISDPADLAAKYAAGGAAAISVLTEQRRFNGSLADLDAVRARVTTPILRKDFIISKYQIYEARAHGADLCLLIVAALSDAELTDYLALVASLGMTALVETHTRTEIVRALDAGASVVGVNNRNLKTLEVDLAQFEELAPLIPAGVIRVAESGILTRSDAERMRIAGADVVLVGEALVKHDDPVAAVRAISAL